MTGLVHADGAREVGDEQRVGDEAGPVADDHGLLAEALGEIAHRRRELVVGEQRRDDLDELQDGRRVEEVHADDALRVLGRRGDLGEREAGGVGGEHGVLTDDVVELAEDVALDLQALRDGLDHEVGVLEVGQLVGPGDPAQDGSLLVLAEPALLDRSTGRGLEEPLAALGELGCAVDADDSEARLGEHLHDAGTHGAESDHADSADLTSHGASVADPGVVSVRRSPCGRRTP